ncbi:MULTISPECIES: glutamine synthetase family protein [Xanthobacter]|uniref:Glutamine synthetase n=1 Tax=Xanthobacter flavus TaxID=281 RepID=A0A9W6CSR6_XANFL|nr:MULTISPECIES: glutamine synthetase family protein [Xanthobacter]MBN8916812.1 glutamine synthetase [Hyphomicrobiales bacterium]MDR6335715.1 glutamine synthetase [Xanthobacter flavus]UJX46462.1 glutamine synthetase [Xanthobacter sp. YC-JY1]GLI24607.1 glutamine synthetase [Xanthobacter flavus]
MAKRSKGAQKTQATAPRGVTSLTEAKAWMASRGITEIECTVPDLAGVARGKIMPASKFFSSPVMNLPLSVFFQTISGEYPDYEGLVDSVIADSDLVLEPDLATLCSVPWAQDPTAQVIHDAYHRDGRPVELAPRQVLRHVISLYEKKGWKPVVAPEIEFYLVEPNTDPDYPLKPPVGRSGRPEIGRQSYSIQAVNEFDALFEDIYDYSEAQGLEIDTLIHEDGAAQMEINLRHGDPLVLADQVFLFKRTIREAALAHKIYATFMAKPIANEPGSAMHIHQSVINTATGRNLFSDEDGDPTPEFFSFIAGHQKYLPSVMCIMAPYVNSYRRLTRDSMAPINLQWGYDNRTAGLRVPPSTPEARRLENRVPSSDANPYLAIAASLACGYLGLTENLRATDPIDGDAKNLDFDLPRGLLEAVAAFQDSEPLAEVLGERFVSAYAAVKQAEFETFMRVISPWEREYLLLNV